jgi:hypothetical protein
MLPSIRLTELGFSELRSGTESESVRVKTESIESESGIPAVCD